MKKTETGVFEVPTFDEDQLMQEPSESFEPSEDKFPHSLHETQPVQEAPRTFKEKICDFFVTLAYFSPAVILVLSLVVLGIVFFNNPHEHNSTYDNFFNSGQTYDENIPDGKACLKIQNLNPDYIDSAFKEAMIPG